MPAYFGKQRISSEKVSSRYLCINNCGYHEDFTRMNVSRPAGRVDYQLIYVKSGQLLLDRGGVTYALTGGDVFLYRPGQPQHYRIDGLRTSFFWVHFTGAAVTEMVEDFPGEPVRTGDFPEFERFCRTYCMEHWLGARPGELYYEGELICLIALTGRRAAGEAGPLSGNLAPALEAIHGNPAGHFSNEALAALCGLNKFYFIKRFRGFTGMAPQQYHTALRMEKARELLESTAEPVSQIAALCGMEDSFYFSRLFKKHTGLSPTEYRGKLRGLS